MGGRMKLILLFQIYFFYSVIKDYHDELEGFYEKSLFFILNFCIGVFTYFTILLVID